MGQVIEIAAARESRLGRAAAAAVMHPALRWVNAADPATAHRRGSKQQRTWCGTPGTLTIAPRGTALCPACYGPQPQ